MTERSGGSDVSGTETVAILTPQPSNSQGIDGAPLGPYSISGFKWFSSATDAEMAVLLARTTSGKLSAFYTPMRRTVPRSAETETETETERNGVRIQRLKEKLGTRAVLTAELELQGMRGYLLGAEGEGVKEIATVLNITRVHNAVTAMGLWGRGLVISRAFARVRRVGKRRLSEIPAHVAMMAGQEVRYQGFMHLTFFAVLLLGITEQASPTENVPTDSFLKRVLPTRAEARVLLRVLTPVVKGLTAKASIAGLSECMESLGGVGYLENEDVELNVARLLRDASVLSIWEGTTDVLAADLVRVLKGREGEGALETLERWVVACRPDEALRGRWERWVGRIRGDEVERLMVEVREVMRELGGVVAGVFLGVEAEVRGEEVAGEVARRWIGGEGGLGMGEEGRGVGWRERGVWDTRIVFGIEGRGERSRF